MHMLLRIALVLLAVSNTHASQQKDKKDAKPAEERKAVPGQAFHDWRMDLIKAQFSDSDASSATAPATASPSAFLQLQQQPWINIVGARERISKMDGPPISPDNQHSSSQEAAGGTGPFGFSCAAAASEQAAKNGTLSHSTDFSIHDYYDDSDDFSTGGTADPKAAHDTNTGSETMSQEMKQEQQQHLPRRLPPVPDSTAHNSGGSSSSSGSSSTGGTSGTLLEKLVALMHQQPYKPTRTTPAQLEDALMSFVQKGPKGRLYLDGKPWLLKGFDVPHALQMAVQGTKQRYQLLYLLDRAQQLGLNTLRFWAFADGAPGIGSAMDRDWEHSDDQQQQQKKKDQQGKELHVVLQPAPGILNATVMSDGLDWLIHEAGLRGLKLLLVFTNGGSSAGGGMKQYIDWVDPALTVNDFYTNDTVKSTFLDYMAGMLLHTSSLSGIPLREDPVVMGYQLAEGASHPGHPSSQVLLAWLKQMGVFIKEHAPHQLLLPGVMEMFGHNSPHHLLLNPPAQVFHPGSHTPHVYTPVCHGTDFWLHNQLPEVDAAAAGLFPDIWLACNASCKLDWAQGWVRGHLRDALRINKPLILAGVGVLRPQTWRLQVLKLVQAEVERALQHEHPMGGVILSGLSHPEMHDESGWSIYYQAQAVQAARPPLASLNEQAVSDVKWRRFMNYDDYLKCTAEQARGVSNDKGEASKPEAWVDGWEDVVRAVAAIGSLDEADSSSSNARGVATAA